MRPPTFATRALLVGLACAWCAGAARPARADTAKPWAVGVSAADQQAALALYQQGNDYFAKDDYADALATYEQALAKWKHPAIYYNAAVCAINLDKPVEAWNDLHEAMRFGPDPIGPEHYRQGKLDLKLLASRVAQVEVHVTVPGATVLFDGQRLDAGTPRHVRAGTHHIVATKEGYAPTTQEPDVKAGQMNVIELVLQPLPSGPQRRLVRRWPKRVPWAIVTGGAVVALVGVPMWVWSGNRFGAYDRAIAACAGGGTFCSDPAALAAAASEHRRGLVDRDLGAAAFVAGGAIVAAGLGLALLNQPHLEHVQPVVAPGRVGLAISARW